MGFQDIDSMLINRIALVLGTISGLLLIPEVTNLIPADRWEASLERILEKLASFPYSYLTRNTPLSWQREASSYDPIFLHFVTSLVTLIFSIIWLGIFIAGIVNDSLLLVLGGILVALLGVIRSITSRWKDDFVKSSRWVRLFVIILAFVTVFLISGPVALIRLTLIGIYSLVANIHRFFQARRVFRGLLLGLAVTSFIASQLLQFIATFE